jgi:Calcineurin-like phosphoesterase
MAAGRIALLTCALVALAAPAAAQNPSFTYVVLGGKGPVARAIMTPAKKKVPPCPRIEVDGASKEMIVRAGPDVKHFKIRVCEFVLGSARKATIGGKALPLPPDKLEKIAVFGDTGCRIKAEKDKAEVSNEADDEEEEDEPKVGNQKPKVQDCRDAKKWPFQTMSVTIANAKPDLVIHVGDYLYRESECPKGYKKDCKDSPYGDKWKTWEADFFTPAAALLKAAPWIVTRGNHEICERAGLGYALLLDPTPVEHKPPKCGRSDPPLDQYTVKAGGRAFIMLDSSAAPDECPSGCDTGWYVDQFAAMKPAPGTWLITHKPIWGFTNSKGVLGTRNKTLQAALNNGGPPAGIDLVLSGHIHLWEALSFDHERPPQFVLGSGSTKLAHEITEDLLGQPIGGATVTAAATDHQFGYTIFEPPQGSGHWDATYYDTDGKKNISCNVDPTKATCKKQ